MRAACLSAGLLAFASCGDEPREITEVRRVVVEPAAPMRSAARFGFDSEPEGGPATAAATPYEWDVPPEWRSLPPTAMRAASFAVTGAPEIDCSLTILPAGGGGLVANLNRWRKQMSLPELTPSELEALPTLPVLGARGAWLECDGTYRGMGNQEPQADAKLLGVAVEHEGRALFVKMVGPKVAVDAERGRLETFCHSLRPATAHVHDEAREAEAPSAEAAAAETGNGTPTTWEAPAGWRRVESGSMRLVSFAVGPNDETEVYVTVLTGSGGGLEANVNRWRQQMAQPELSAPEIAALPEIPMLGRRGRFVRIRGHFTGMAGEKQNDAMMLGAVCELADQSVFVKMVGPAETVAAEEQRFADFCRSLQ
jgi:hypothetical protein